MRKVTFGGANSLDNYFARKDDSVDRLMWGKEAASVMTDFWKTIDTVVMGRRTYETSGRQRHLCNGRRLAGEVAFRGGPDR
jgi:dihydrofolate reductase